MPKNGDDVNGTPLMGEGIGKLEVPCLQWADDHGAGPKSPFRAPGAGNRGNRAFSSHPGGRSWD